MMESSTLDRTEGRTNGSSALETPPAPEANSSDGDGEDEAQAEATEQRIPLKVLIADVDKELMESCRSILEHEGHECEVLSESGAIRNALARDNHDLVFLYERIPGLDTESLLRMTRDHASGSLVVLTADKTSPERARRAMGMGAWDYLTKPFASDQLLSLLGRASYTVGQTHRIRGKSSQDGVLLKNGLTILGISPQIRSAVEKALRVAATDAPVLLTGESGTGKELFSRLIHEHSRRVRAPFVPLNCAALPGELLESEMFGHRKGAFTGAVRDKPGILEAAHRGTVFLDELAEMPVTLQAKLLRVVQDGALRRVGSEDIDRKVDVRIISATNRDPESALASGRLREDLLYRLGVVAIELAPLRERPDDIPVLTRHLTPVLWQKYRPSVGPPPTFADDALDALLSHPWPGNVRELENVIGHAVIFTQPGRAIRADDLPLNHGRARGRGFAWTEGEHGADGTEGRGDFDLQPPYHDAKERMLARFERAYVSRLIARAEGNLCEAARRAEINRTTLYRLMDKHGLSREALTETAEPASSTAGEGESPAN